MSEALIQGIIYFSRLASRGRTLIYLELAMITAVEMWIDDGETQHAQWAKFSISAVT